MKKIILTTLFITSIIFSNRSSCATKEPEKDETYYGIYNLWGATQSASDTFWGMFGYTAQHPAHVAVETDDGVLVVPVGCGDREELENASKVKVGEKNPGTGQVEKLSSVVGITPEVLGEPSSAIVAALENAVLRYREKVEPETVPPAKTPPNNCLAIVPWQSPATVKFFTGQIPRVPRPLEIPELTKAAIIINQSALQERPMITLDTKAVTALVPWQPPVDLNPAPAHLGAIVEGVAYLDGEEVDDGGQVEFLNPLYQPDATQNPHLATLPEEDEGEWLSDDSFEEEEPLLTDDEFDLELLVAGGFLPEEDLPATPAPSLKSKKPKKHKVKMQSPMRPKLDTKTKKLLQAGVAAVALSGKSKSPWIAVLGRPLRNSIAPNSKHPKKRR